MRGGFSGEDPLQMAAHEWRSATLAVATWSHWWPTGEYTGLLGVPFECGVTVATVAIVCGRTGRPLVTHKQPRMMFPAAFQRSFAQAGTQFLTVSIPPPAP